MTPLSSTFRTIGYVLAGRLHFPRAGLGATFTDERGQRFRVFRRAVLDPRPGQSPIPGAVFVPRFHIKGMSWRTNILFSLLPIPFFVGLPGFRSKCWLVDETSGDFCGYYEWDTLADAEAYSRSFAMRFMTRRAVPGSVFCRVYPAQSAPPAPE